MSTTRDAEGDGGSRSAPLPSGQAIPPHHVQPAEPPFGSYFVAAYPPFSCWTPAAVDDYRRVLARSPEPDPAPRLGLYVHIPFCVDRCRYCYYLSYDRQETESIDAYIDALVDEAARYGEMPAVCDRELDFVYVGGGTPSLLSTARLERLFAGLRTSLRLGAVREVTFECAPKSVTGAKARLLRDAGVTRLSLGVQQLDDDVLQRNGRVHLAADVEAAYEAVSAAGFPIINVDLMVGMVGETAESFFGSLERVVALQPDSVTIYQMEIPLNTPLYRDLKAGAESEPLSWEGKHERLMQGFDRLQAADYHPISAYTMVRDPARHDFLYQREQYHGADLLGIGTSSFSYVQGVHQQNAAALGDYLDAVQAGDMPFGRAYTLDDEERLVRELVLQLKLGTVERAAFRTKFGADPVLRFAPVLQELRELDWVGWDDDEVRLTRSGLPRADRLLPRFYLPTHRGVRYS